MQNVVFATVPTWLEITYQITSGPLLLLAAIYGLKSLALTKEIAAKAERRASLTATAERLHYFSAHVSPLFDRLDAFVIENKIAWFSAFEVGLDDDGEVFVRSITEYSGKELKDVVDVFLPALNALSAWCSYFVNEVADEKVAYKTLAADFIHQAEKCIPMILLGKKQTPHADLLTLYEMWRGRLEQEAIAEAKIDLETRLNELRRGDDVKRQAD